MYQIAASIMCANQMELEKELKELENAKVELLHCDVMDGIFVNNLAMGPYVLEEIGKTTSIPLDIHLATITPTKYIKMFSELKPKYISFHIETSENVKKDIELLREAGISPSIAVSPKTPVKEIFEYLPFIDMVLMMTVNPGFAGQPFNYEVVEKIKELYDHIKDWENPPLIEVDGNINEKTIPVLKENGANIYVVGTSALFNKNSGTYKDKIQNLNKLFGK